MKGAWVALIFAGCGAPVLPQDLFTVDAANAEYPVMLSHAGRCAGRPIRAKSGVAEASDQHQWEEGWSEHSASSQFLSQVALDEKWVQVERVVYSARNVTRWASRDQVRELSVEGVACP